MLNQIRYFQTVAECGSFTEAAELQHISQSAISQQIQALEAQLGVKLINREKRKISLTPAGEVFYRKSIVLVADYDRLVMETQKAGSDDVATLKIGVLLTYGGEELQMAIAEFSRKYPQVKIDVITANHEELFHAIHDDQVDILLSDQRRAFSSDYENIIARTNLCHVEVSKESALAKLSEIHPEDLRNTPCILVASEKEEYNERQYYKTIFGFNGEYLFARTIKDARLMVVSNRGFMPVEGSPVMSHFQETIARIPLVIGREQFERNLCIFWRKDNSGYYIEEFGEILDKEFQKTRNYV